MATWQGATVSWGGTPVGKVVGGDGDSVLNAVVCTTLDDTAEDIRAGNANPTASLVISLKDSNTNPFTLDDHKALVIESDFNHVMRCMGVKSAPSVDGHKTIEVTFASTAESVGT